jgi:Circularly permutated YpsA SLOG family
LMALHKIISGGQTGVDRGALDAALAAEFSFGGWCPANRAAEDGPIPARYPLIPLARGGYPERTRQNVLDSDGTAILFHDVLGGGTLLTLNLCKREGKPHVVIDASKASESEAAAEIARFVEEHEIHVLNVAGPRASGWKQGHEFASRTVGDLIARCRGRAGQ